MSEIQASGGAAKRGPGKLTLAILGLALVGVAAVLYVIVAAVIKPKPGGDLSQFAHGALAKLQVVSPQPGAAMPDTPFLDAQGKTTHLADLKSGLVIVNLWATWCAPCRMEMPALAKLQAAYPGRVQVIPISMDGAEDREKARAFIGQYPSLPFYQDTNLAISFALTPAAEALPTTLIYDRAGHERARLSGGADWDSPEAHQLVEALLSSK